MRKLILLVSLPFVVDAAVAYALAQPSAASSVLAETYPVFFDWDQAALSQHARTELAAAHRAAAGGRAVRISVTGAQDALVGPAYSAALAQARRRSVVAELQQGGAPVPMLLDVAE